MLQNNKIVTRSGSTSSLNTVGSQAKRSREDISKHDDEEIASLNDLWTKMQNMMFSTSERIEAKIESCNNVLEKRISLVESQLAAVRDEFSGRVVRLEEEVTATRNEMDYIAESVRRCDKNKELIISGVPYQNQEDLVEVFKRISGSIGFKETKIPLVELQRLSRSPIAPGLTPPILCEFALRNHRNEFYRNYLSKRSLCLRHIGFESENRIYINENLTPNARRIRSEAVKLKKAGRLDSVTTRDGIVYVKPKGSEKATALHSLPQVASFIRNPIQ